MRCRKIRPAASDADETHGPLGHDDGHDNYTEDSDEAFAGVPEEAENDERSRGEEHDFERQRIIGHVKGDDSEKDDGSHRDVGEHSRFRDFILALITDIAYGCDDYQERREPIQAEQKERQSLPTGLISLLMAVHLKHTSSWILPIRFRMTTRKAV